jgi:polar amino acid transport system substrate-binding protein
MSALLFVTEDYPPYNYLINGSPEGISVDLLRAMSDKLNVTSVDQRIRVMPWATSYQIALKYNNTVLFSTVRLPERENQFKWVGPIGTSQKVIFAKKDRVINISSPTDLQQYRIGYVNEDAAQAQLKALGIPDKNIIPFSNLSYLINGAQEDKIDLWCFGDLAGRYFARKVIGDANAFTPVYTLDTYDLYYAFNKDTPNSTVKSFQDALDIIRTKPDQSGITEYQRIIMRNS